jgi:hypothetical protein
MQLLATVASNETAARSEISQHNEDEAQQGAARVRSGRLPFDGAASILLLLQHFKRSMASPSDAAALLDGQIAAIAMPPNQFAGRLSIEPHGKARMAHGTRVVTRELRAEDRR